MGRGRAKAIQKKIARDLKYSSGATDLERLRAELSGGAPEQVEPDSGEDDEDDDDEPGDEEKYDLGGGD